jgi:ribulose-5-phosphate 4-epimerase/fuculose-1-phosphate aldolase
VTRSKKTTPLRRAGIGAAEWRCRVDLAAAYRLMDHFGVRDLTYNHLSARVPDQGNALLLKPADHMFGEITASSLLKYDLDGNPLDGSKRQLGGGALVIHAGLMRLRPSVNAVFHTHTPANMAVSAQKRGLLPLSQQAMLFHGRIAYHGFAGFEFEPGMEVALDRSLGTHRVSILRNHGALIVAETVAEAFVTHHFLEIACQAQVGALTADEIVVPPEDVCARAAAQMDAVSATKNGGKNWEACLRLARRLFPDFES